MSKVLLERTDIAKALNFGKYPVLSIDIDNVPCKEDPSYMLGCNCRVAWDKEGYEGMSSRCQLDLYNGKFSLISGGACLKSSYDYEDFIKDVESANTPLVHKGQEVVIAMYSSKLKTYIGVKVLKVSDRIDTNCITVATLEEVE